jgi:hypothetical protein
MPRIRHALRTLLPIALLAVAAASAAAQDMGLDPPTELARQSLRPYWHVFIAYTIAILLVGAWAGSIAKRLADIEKRLGE